MTTEWTVIESDAASSRVAEHLKEKTGQEKNKLGRSKKKKRLAADWLIECIKGSELPC